MKRISILGCCVLRDAFRISDTEQKYDIENFYQSISPISICDKPPSIKLTEHDLSIFEWRNFIKKNICSDFNKDVMSVYRQKVSEYIIVDLCELRFKNNLITLNTGEKIHLTNNVYMSDLIKNLDVLPPFKDAIVEENVHIGEEYVFKCIEKYISFLTEIYPQKNIIMVRNMPYHKFVDDEKREIGDFYANTITTIRDNFLKYYDFVEKKFPEINMIRMPENCICYAQHLWGIDPLHFYDEYYHYLYKCIDLICNNAPDKKARIEELRAIYSDYFRILEQKKRTEFLSDAFVNSHNVLKNPKLIDLSEWKLSFSLGSNFDENKKLSCAAGTPCWAIVCQPLDPYTLSEKEVTISVKFKTYKNSKLNMCIRTKNNDGQYNYLLFNQFSNDDSITVAHTTDFLPAADKLTDAHFMIYLNSPNSSATIEEVKLELGDKSTLY